MSVVLALGILLAPCGQDEPITILASSDIAAWEGLSVSQEADLRVCLGGSLFASPEGKATNGLFSLEALVKARFDAVGLSREERAHLPKDRKAPFLGRDPIVKTVRFFRIAFIAFDGDGTGLPDLAARARKDASVVILLAYAPKETVAKLLRDLKGVDLCLVPGGPLLDPEPLKVGETWLVDVPRGGRAPARVRLWIEENKLARVTNEIGFRRGKQEEWLGDLRKKHKIRTVEGDAWVDRLGKVGPADGAGAEVPARLTVGEATEVGIYGRNRAVEIYVSSLLLRNEFGARVAPSGRNLLIVTTEWMNRIPLSLVYERKIPTEYRIPDLREALYLVVDGRRIARLYRDAGRIPGHLPAGKIALKKAGAYLRGMLLFEIPAQGVRSLELRLYDFGHGHIRIPLFRAKEAPPEEKPVAIAKNDVMEAGVFDLRRTKEWRGRKAPPNGTFLVLDFRARSLVEFEVDATAFLPKAKPGEKIKSGTMFDFQDFPTSLHLVVDGKNKVLPLGAEAAPRFLPDLLTGEEIAFVVPEKTISVELLVELRNLRLPSGRVLHPESLRFAIEAKRP